MRYPHDPAPLVPWTKERYRWPESRDPDVEKVRREVQEGGPGLFILVRMDGRKALVEAYYPEGFRPEFVSKWLDPYREADLRMGRLTVVEELVNYRGELSPRVLENIRKNNRNARLHLQRKTSRAQRAQHAQELRELQEKEELERIDTELGGYIDEYVERSLDTMKKYRGAVSVRQPGLSN